jgi:signal transduction histidine kinase
MGSGNLSVRSSITSRDEIGKLASRFNDMAERLQASFRQLAEERDALRRFIADASHELRTPITALNNFNELLQGPAAGDESARAEFLAESQVQIDRLGWITKNLLDLSRIDAGLVSLDRKPCDVGDLLVSASAPFKSLAAEKGILLDVRVPDPAFQVDCDPSRFELALSNLLDNAVKYSPPGGTVELSAARAGEKTVLSVADEGPGILAEDLPRIFERFYRGRHAAGPGSGLGLSIVASIVQAHGGRVWAENRPTQGAKFVIEC